jgi:hypothetical protein
MDQRQRVYLMREREGRGTGECAARGPSPTATSIWEGVTQDIESGGQAPRQQPQSPASGGDDRGSSDQSRGADDLSDGV